MLVSVGLEVHGVWMVNLSASFVVPVVALGVLGGGAVLPALRGDEIEAARQEGIEAVLNDPEAYGLYSERSILDLNMGGIMLKAVDGGFEVDFVLEISDDLSEWEVFEVFQRFLPNSGEKSFLRLRAFIPPDLAPPSILVYEHSQLGPILTDAEGYVLYRLEFDLPGAAPVDHASWPAVWDVDRDRKS